MKKLIFLFLALSVFAIPSRAQSVDVSVGYSYFRLGGSGGINQNGVSGSVAYNLKSFDWLGIVGDFGGYHASPLGVSLNTYTYLFGPRLTLRNPSKFNPFGQVLLGGSRLTAGGGSSNQFAYSLGAGVDIGLLPHLALRPQVDYVGLNTPGSHTNCTRVSAGLVVHF
jgi:outer membrane immunogenic protein